MSAAQPVVGGREVDVRHVVKDGALVAVLTAFDQGATFTVVTEVYAPGGETPGPVSRRPYTFPDAATGRAFIAEAATAFTYLGCEIRSQ